MRLMMAIAVAAAGVIAPVAAIADSSKDDWFDEDCAVKAQQRWCVPKLKHGGWTLRYQDKSPEDLTDAFWQIDVWIKGPDALVCELKGGRGGLRSNGCYSLREVPPAR